MVKRCLIKIFAVSIPSDPQTHLPVKENLRCLKRTANPRRRCLASRTPRYPIEFGCRFDDKTCQSKVLGLKPPIWIVKTLQMLYLEGRGCFKSSLCSISNWVCLDWTASICCCKFWTDDRSLVCLTCFAAWTSSSVFSPRIRNSSAIWSSRSWK